MTRRPRAWRHLWIAASRPSAMPLADYLREYNPVRRIKSSPDNDNARPVKTLSLDVERWVSRQREAR